MFQECRETLDCSRNVLPHVLVPEKLYIGMISLGPATNEVLEVVPIEMPSLLKHVHAGLEWALEHGPALVVVEEGHSGVLRVPGDVDHLAFVLDVWGKELEGEMCLDHSPALHVGHVLHRVVQVRLHLGILVLYPDALETRGVEKGPTLQPRTSQ